jgi:hypothetical protein
VPRRTVPDGEPLESLLQVSEALGGCPTGWLL